MSRETHNGRSGRPGLTDRLGATLAGLGEAGRAQYERLFDQRIRIGVTGFSGSGKTSFVTSLVNQLLLHSEASLAALPPSLHERILGVRLHGSLQAGLPAFPYAAAAERLSGPSPRWPESTTAPSGLLLEIRYRARRRLLSVPGRAIRSLFVEIRDYPGEWLLDLPMLRASYRDWCVDRGGDYHRAPRRDLLGPLYDRLQALDPLQPAAEASLQQLVVEHRAFLQRCRLHRLSLNQPGRDLLDSGGDDADGFLPLLNLAGIEPERLRKAAADCWYKRLQSRYDAYVRTQVQPFFKSYFESVDRQVILVDLLSSLSFGSENFADMSAAMARVLDTYRFGSNSLLQRLFDPRIDRVIYVASKIDHVHPGEHDRVRQLLWRLLKNAIRNVGFDRTDVHNAAIAAVRCTMPAPESADAGLLATTIEGRRGVMTHPQMPDRAPNDADWQRLQGWRLPVLQPPPGQDYLHRDAIPHIRMDTVIRELIGDKFQ